MRKVISLNGEWKLAPCAKARTRPRSGWIPARVPGDVHADLSRAGQLPEDLFYRKNMMEVKWVGKKNWWYETEFSLDTKSKNHLELVFEGVDLFARVYLNGEEIGFANNAHREFRFDVTSKARKGKNRLSVEFLSTIRELEKLHRKYPDHQAIFTEGRSLLRKAQCQFGWDWSPEALSLGLWKDVYLEERVGLCIEDVFVETQVNGDCCFLVTLSDRAFDQTLVLEIGDLDGHRVEVATQGRKNFIGVTIPDPELWWPHGWGKPHQYSYSIALKEGRRSLDKRKGRFGIRSVELEERVLEKDQIGLTLRVNGHPIFCKGANWVPTHIFPGLAEDETYVRLVQHAQDANFNMLRVWGGGIYEKERFYEECDRLGIMVWQDFANACADVPDDVQSMLENIIEEGEYQVKRLRHHPSIVLWCGGNESSSAFHFNSTYPGKRLFHYYYRGLVNDLVAQSAYFPTSPFSKSDLGSAQTSGESHWSSWPNKKDSVIEWGNFRDRFKDVRTVFNGEVAEQGPSPMESQLKFLKHSDIWPPNEVVDYHVMNHPHPDMIHVHPRYVIDQLMIAEQLIGPCDSAESFIARASMGHAEVLREDLEFYRMKKFDNSGALVWMYNEPWPGSNWALIDFYGQIKPALYAVRRAFAPLAVSIKRVEKDFTVHLLNDTLQPASGTLTLICMDIHGKEYWRKSAKETALANTSATPMTLKAGNVRSASAFLRAEWRVGDETFTTHYFPKPWKEYPFSTATVDVEIVDRNRRTESGYATRLRVSSPTYARFVRLRVKNSDGVRDRWSDNYFDLIPDESRMITLTTPKRINGVDASTLL